jgi:selenocysteine-specific elongation factor
VRRVGDWLVDPGRFEDLLRGMESAVAEFHRRNPLAPGRPREEARSGVMPELFEALIASSKTLVAEGDVVRLKTHRVVLKQDESEASAKIEGLFREAGLAVPGVNEVLGKSGLDAARARTILQMLLREKKLVRASDELVFHAGAIAGLKSQLTARKGQRFTVPEFKEWTGISRKYAIPLLELLDRERVTRRDGDTRIVL